MSKCKHTRWLRLSRNNQDLDLEVSDRPQRLLDNLKAPDTQYPSLIAVVGNQSKLRWLNHVGINVAGPRGVRGHGEIHIHAVPSSARKNHPVVIFDGDVPSHNRFARPCRPQTCHEASVQVFPRSTHGNVKEKADDLYRRLLLPFLDVICFFAADLGGLEQVAYRLALWVEKKPLPTVNLRPYLVIVIDEGIERDAMAAFDDRMRAETGIDLQCHFRDLHIVSLSKSENVGQKSSRGGRRNSRQNSQWKRLHSKLVKLLSLSRQARVDTGYLFSARHLAGLLRHAAKLTSEISHEPFDWVRMSRFKREPAQDLNVHLTNFLTHFKSTDSLTQFGLPVIASSFLLDHYAPGMHPFPPRHVITSLYKSSCMSVHQITVQQSPGDVLLPSTFAELLEEELVSLFQRYIHSGSSKLLHQQVLAGFHQQWAAIHSDATCFCCLRRRPQFGLPCKHAVCENCVKVFGRVDENDPWLFHVDACFLCQTETPGITIRVKPDTAGIRVLSIDGGGTRGRVPLEFIHILQERIGLPCPVQRNFDVVYGTSSGAIIACALFINGWSIEDCIASFESLSRLAFTPRWSCWIPLLSKIYDFILSILADSRYPARNLEKALQEVFGLTRTMIEYSNASEMGTMIGVPVTTIRDAALCVFTNYNGVGNRETNNDYHVLQNSARVLLWEVLRCATAAPYYFRPRHILGLGTFQDGGLLFNNPVTIAMQEAAALFPATPKPSLVVSLGTGSARKGRPDTSTSRCFWRDSFPLRVFRAFWQSGSSSRAWTQLLSHQEMGNKGEFFRFDIEFDGPEPALDDVLVMEEIRDEARDAMLDSPTLDRLVLRTRAELFFFELDPERPYQLIGGVYECVGRISCRLRARTPEFEAFMAQLNASSAKFLISDRVLPTDFQDRFTRLRDGNFSKVIKFQTPSRQDPITISLREKDTAYPISGAPFSLQWLIDAQQLEARFGQQDHRKRKWPICKVEQEARRKKARRR
ncbi:acyl transferase/acyl hydrolase/lysophospholipase [Stachybotrys elegans]|uniref:Acyl transferase/acyl hydrolase/lysophospholipase n=1 Tax=Stachybotrys elegans TaxID=80388 RepID=A0A8K0SH05_9HYPO|nr:acyl transferase/acyl hydrolase/lysophospholipase [Stachybotrys elegans]